MARYMGQYAPGWFKGITGDITTATLNTIVNRVTMAILLQRGATAWIPFAGWVLLGDAVANTAQTIRRLFQMSDAAKEAKDSYCDCKKQYVGRAE